MSHALRASGLSRAEVSNIQALICQKMDSVRDMITSEASWHWLEEQFYEVLHGRQTLPAAAVLAWADAGHPAADRAVRRYGAEMLDTHRETELLAQVRAQIIKILLRPLVPFPQGRHVVANIMRDLWLPVLIERVAEDAGLAPTRSTTAATPSAAFYVSKTLRRRGMKMSEKRLNQIYWRRGKLGEGLKASLVSIAPSIIK